MDEIIDVISSEVGKPPMDALTGDIMVTLEHLRFYERSAPSILRPRKGGKPALLFRGARFETILEPHGVVLVCAPWNYPLQLSIIPTATALFAGNAVLLKCSEHTPRTAQLIASLCGAADLPTNLVQISCEPPEAAAAIIDARPDFIFFTGSNRNGRAVAAKAAALMIPSVMELGGKDAALVFDSCDLPRAVNGLVYGVFSNSGQVCVGTKRIYVQRPIYDEFLRRFLERISHLRTGTRLESDLGPIRIGGIRERLSDQLSDALARGAKLHTVANEAGAVVLTDVSPDASLMQDESFGPIVCIAPFITESDAISAANSSAFALSASVWTGDKLQAQRVALALNTGGCTINDVIRSIGNPHAAFGGNQSSGHGRYHGTEGLRTFSRMKSIMTSTRPRPAEIHWFPFTNVTFARLRALLHFRHASGLRNKLRALTGGHS
jgi:acyl-CoA reductase-like NAD-dependent aldehyde dehydrogenase